MRSSSTIFRYMSNYLDNDTDKLADAFKALSNPNRLKIFLQLMNCCTPGTVCRSEDLSPDLIAKSCVGDLGEGLGIAASTLSHHIKELSRAGLIQMERRGQHVDCWVNPDAVKELNLFFQSET